MTTEAPLEGWKEICAHVGLSEKPARARATWGVEARMPVYFSRIKGRVIAMRSELDRWKADQLLPVGVAPIRRSRLRGSRRLPLPPVGVRSRARIKAGAR